MIPVDGTPAGILEVDGHLTATDERRIAETLFALLADMEIDTDRAHGPTLVVIGSDLLTGNPAAILLESHDGDGGDAMGMIGPMVEQGLSVVVLTADADPEVGARCLQAGAMGVLIKGQTTRAAMRDAVNDIGAERQTPGSADGEAPTAEVRRERTRRLDLSKRLDRLTPRESDVLRLIGDGHSAAEIAEMSFVALATVRSQIRSVLAKVEVNSQIAVVAAAHRDGWFDRTGHDK
jgi:DNA-binding NarL/FixJ family response regulator